MQGNGSDAANYREAKENAVLGNDLTKKLIEENNKIGEMLAYINRLEESDLRNQDSKDEYIDKFESQLEQFYLHGIRKNLDRNAPENSILAFMPYSENELPKLGLFKDDEKEFRFVLPPLFSKHYSKNKQSIDGRVVTGMIKDMISEYQKANGELPKFGYSKITFRFYAERTPGGKYLFPDGDNVNMKKIIDTLQGVFFDNDSLAELEQSVVGIKAEKTYCEVVITGK